MSITLTEPQLQALDATQPEPLRLIDPRTQQSYVLLPAETFERLQAVLDDGLDRRQVAELIERTMREEDAGDPLLDSYQKYRAAP